MLGPTSSPTRRQELAEFIGKLCEAILRRQRPADPHSLLMSAFHLAAPTGAEPYGLPVGGLAGH
jgi:hypothetical protein